MLEKRIKNFIPGVIDTIEDFSIPDGALSAVKNWFPMNSKVELSRGVTLAGTADETGTEVTGLHVARKMDGTQVWFKKIGRKLMYYDDSLGVPEWAECGTNLFPATATTELVLFSDYISEAGAQVFFGSPNSSLYKVMVANPGSYSDMYYATTNFKGYVKVDNRWTWLWNFIDDGLNVSDTRRSKIDQRTYTAVDDESIGIAGSLTYTGTLAYRAGGARRTCFKVSFTDGVETFTDALQTGTLTGSAGGTGTINYTTGAYSITFNAVAAGAVTSDYFWEDSSDTGILDYRFTTPTRLAGEGMLFLQGMYGTLQNVHTYQNTTFCIHRLGTYKVFIDETDLVVSNLPFLETMGIESPTASFADISGVYWVSSEDKNDPQVNRLAINSQGNFTPTSISRPWKINNGYEGIDLSDYRFEKSAMTFFSGYIVLSCRSSDRDANDTLLFFDEAGKSITIRKTPIRLLSVYGSDLVGGSSCSYNAYFILKGFADEDVEISNSVEFKSDDMGYPGEAKKCLTIGLRGEIQDNQDYQVWLSSDGGNYANVGEVNWDGSYVDRAVTVLIGTHGIGENVIAGDETVEVHPYKKEIKIMTPRFNELKLKLIATGAGYVSVTEYWWKGLRRLGQKLI